MCSVCIIVIGDEILKGQVEERNSRYACQRLFQSNVQVQRISVIGDNIDEIAEEVKKLKEKYDVVIACGGIGSTHDDVTYEAIANTFDSDIFLHPEFEKVIRKILPMNCNGPKSALKMAMVPRCSELIFIPQEGKVAYPVVKVSNVYILPGVPTYFEMSFDFLLPRFQNLEKRIFKKCIRVCATETDILDCINSTVEEFKDVVSVGSYPSTDGHDFTRIRLQSMNAGELNAASLYFVSLVQSDHRWEIEEDDITDSDTWNCNIISKRREENDQSR